MALSLPDFERPPRFELMAPVVSQNPVIGQEHEIVFSAPPIAQHARPGQFLEILFGNSYAPLLRRPFSIYRVDREAGTCSILYLARGAFTSALAQRRVGDAVSLLGPLGRPFTWPTAPATRHVLIAGGIGAPPLLFLARELCRERAEQSAAIGPIHVLNGARTAELLVGMTELETLEVELEAVTDDGSFGQRARVAEALPPLLDALPQGPTQLYSCGPMPMLRAVGALALTRHLSCQVSVETPMPCGIGTCEGCAIAVHAP
ncbi:MAG TPA: dihydroorotate dehydrogenase electron transfer subunit, partial [Chthonomonadaceae bacterium]|nr:dihydroorotate dehydrogenase electron transfer subunit [Chthonomonadaceae bacterium]